MQEYLIKTVETYRLPTEEAVDEFLEELKKEQIFEVVKYSSTKKEIKSKGEVEETYYRVEVTKLFNDEKECYDKIAVNYEKE